MIRKNHTMPGEVQFVKLRPSRRVTNFIEKYIAKWAKKEMPDYCKLYCSYKVLLKKRYETGVIDCEVKVVDPYGYEHKRSDQGANSKLALINCLSLFNFKQNNFNNHFDDHAQPVTPPRN